MNTSFISTKQLKDLVNGKRNIKWCSDKREINIHNDSKSSTQFSIYTKLSLK